VTTFRDLAQAVPELLERERRALAGEPASDGLFCLLLGVRSIPDRMNRVAENLLFDLVDLATDWLDFCSRFGHRPDEGTEAERRAYTASIARSAPFGDDWRFRSYDPLRSEPIDFDEIRERCGRCGR